jgi:hypothetical protein
MPLSQAQKKAAQLPGPPCDGFHHAPISHAAITTITFAAMLMLHRRRSLWRPLTALKRRRKAWSAVMRRRSGAAVAAVHAVGLRLRQRPSEMLRAHARVLAAMLMPELLGSWATHAIMWRQRLRPLKVLRAHALMVATGPMSELLRSGTVMLLKAGCRAATSAESRISTRTAELLLPSAKAMPHATTHPAQPTATAVHLPILWAALRRTETFTATRCAKGSPLGKRLRTTTFQSRPETTLLMATRP